MVLTTANVNGLYDFRVLANQYQDTTRATPITVAGGSQIVKGSTDTSPVGTRHLTSDTGIGYNATGNSRALVFSGSQATALASFGGGNVFNSSSPNRVEINIDLMFVMPAQTLSAPQTIFGLGHSSGTSLFTISLTTDNKFSVSHRTSTGSATNAAIFGPWAFDTVHMLSVRLRADTGMIEVLLDGAALAVTQSAAFETGTMSLNRESLGARVTSSYSNYYTGRVFYLRTGLARADADRTADHNELNAGKPSYAAVPAITRTNATYLRGLSSSNPVMPIAGSVSNVSGTPSKLLASVIRVADSVVVKAMADTGATFTGSAFAGGQVTAIPAGGPYRLAFEVRDSANTVLASIDGGITFLVGKVMVTFGSSTGEHMGVEGTGPASPTTAIFNANLEDSWRINDPQGAGFTNLGVALTAATGEPTIIVNCNRGGTSLDEFLLNTGGVRSLVINTVAKVGTYCDMIFAGAGANDTFKPYSASNSATIRSRQSHFDRLRQAIGYVLSAVGKTEAQVRVIIAGVNNRTSDSTNAASVDGDSRPTMTRGAEISLARAIPNGVYVSPMDLETTSGDIHLTTAAEGLYGTRCGKALARPVGQLAHPRITAAALVSDGIELTVQHSTGTDFGAMPSGGWVGFRVYDDTGAYQTLTATRLSATKLKVAFAPDPARKYQVGHLNGTRTTPQSSICLDNSAPALSLEPTITTVGDVLLGDGSVLTVTN